MKLSICCLLLLVLAGCTPEKRSPDAIRQDTARVTSEAARDAKAVAQGVVDGVKEAGTVNINKASVDRLEKLPGMDAASAQRIIDHRPYSDIHDLVQRHILSKGEYDRIAAQITAK